MISFNWFGIIKKKDEEGINMFADRPFVRFSDENEKMQYMVKYGFVSSLSSKKEALYIVDNRKRVKCELIGYEENYDDWSISVVDFGKGPYFIHCDYLKDMQNPDRNKGNKLDKVPSSFTIFDLETTGKNIYECEIIQISAIKVENLEIVDTFDTFVKPENGIPTEITKLTGITDLDVCMAPEESEALQSFLSWLGNSVVAGYNIQRYDTNIVYDHCKQIWDIDFNNDYVDFIYNFKEMLLEKGAELKNYKETTIAEYLGIDTSGAHNGLNDCKICLEIYKRLLSNDTTSAVVIEDEGEINRYDNIVEEKIVQMLNKLISELKLPQDSLYLYSNMKRDGSGAATKSIVIHEPEYPIGAYSSKDRNIAVARIQYKSYKTKEDELHFLVVENRFNKVPYTGCLEVKEPTDSGNEYAIKVSPKDTSIVEYLEELTRYSVKHYRSSNTFGCCSKQAECKEAGECLHINRLYATGCMYRKFVETE